MKKTVLRKMRKDLFVLSVSNAENKKLTGVLHYWIDIIDKATGVN